MKKRPLPPSQSGSGYRPTVVIDNGADKIRVGFGGEPSPRFVMPNCTAKIKGQLQVRRVVVVVVVVDQGLKVRRRVVG